jgi:hypothetical protein
MHNNKMKKTRASNTMNTEYPYISTNRFTPLSNLNEIQQDEMDHTCKCELSQTTHSSTKTTSQRSLGSKILTIVNGRISYSENKKPLEKPSNSLCISNHRSTKLVHKVKIIRDSHLRGLATRINQYLNTKFEICSLIKPGASANQLVFSQEKEKMMMLLSLMVKQMIVTSLVVRKMKF